MSVAAGCAVDDSPEEVAELAATMPAGPPPDAERLDWNTAALHPSSDPNSDYMRAQQLMGLLSSWVYAGDQTFQERAIPRGFMGLKSVHHQSGELGVGGADAMWGSTLHGKMGFLVVRGSNIRGDYLTDLFSAPTLPSDLGGPSKATLHNGFQNYAETIYQGLRSTMLQVCPPVVDGAQAPLWIAGHSLGGAVATILAERLVNDGCNVRGVVTLGSPRPGLTDFQNLYNGTTLRDGTSLATVTSRWVNGEDPMPCLAPGGAWKHVGRHNMINRAGKVVIDAGRDACETPDGAIAVLQAALNPIAFLDGSPEAQALMDFVRGQLVLRLACNANADWDDYLSLGLCKVAEVGTRLVDAYGALNPDTIIVRGLDMFLNSENHYPNRYIEDMPADFELAGRASRHDYDLDPARTHRGERTDGDRDGDGRLVSARPRREREELGVRVQTCCWPPGTLRLPHPRQ
jgi:pimeloyl-ACP methyl ester carboxylesterase